MTGSEIEPRPRNDQTSQDARNAAAVARASERSRDHPNHKLLGWRVLQANLEDGVVIGEFNATRDFTHAGGMIGGGFIAAMLDTVVSGALALDDAEPRPHVTTSLTVNFIGSAAPGPIQGRGHVVRQGRSVAFMEGQLRTAEGELIATATATARFLTTGPRPGAS